MTALTAVNGRINPACTLICDPIDVPGGTMMGKKITALQLLQAAALATYLLTPSAWAQTAAPPAKPAAAKPAPAAAKPVKFDASGCFGCHAPIQAFHDSGKHKGLACSACHSGIENHLGNPASRPVTSTDPATCGACHKNQFDTAYQMDWQRTGRFEKKQATGPSPDPAFDLLMTPHGFTQRTQPAALARLHGARSVRRRPRVRRPFQSQGQLALPGEKRRQLQGLGRHPGRLPGQHRPEAVQAGHCGGGESRSASRARRRITSSNGRTWATRRRVPSGAARRRWSR